MNALNLAWNEAALEELGRLLDMKEITDGYWDEVFNRVHDIDKKSDPDTYLDKLIEVVDEVSKMAEKDGYQEIADRLGNILGELINMKGI